MNLQIVSFELYQSVWFAWCQSLVPCSFSQHSELTKQNAAFFSNWRFWKSFVIIITCERLRWATGMTQPDRTLFFLIFTYLWGISHRSFRNYGSNTTTYGFLSLKPIKVSSDFILNYLKKSCRGRHHSEISKTNIKTMISSLWMSKKQKVLKDQ